MVTLLKVVAGIVLTLIGVAIIMGFMAVAAVVGGITVLAFIGLSVAILIVFAIMDAWDSYKRYRKKKQQVKACRNA